MRVKKIFLYQQIYQNLQCHLDSLWHLIGKAGSISSFSSEDAFPSVSLSANYSDSEENEKVLILHGECWLVCYVQQNKINKMDNNSDS